MHILAHLIAYQFHLGGWHFGRYVLYPPHLFSFRTPGGIYTT